MAVRIEVGWISRGVADTVNGRLLLKNPNERAVERATVRQKKTGQPVRFELTEQTRQAIDEYMKAAGRKPGELARQVSRY